VNITAIPASLARPAPAWARGSRPRRALRRLNRGWTRPEHYRIRAGTRHPGRFRASVACRSRASVPPRFIATGSQTAA